MNSLRQREWLETDGLGGFASGTVSGVRTRRYHGLLVSATTPPTGRMMLVSGVDITIETGGGLWSLSSQRYAPDVIGGDGEQHLEGFVCGGADLRGPAAERMLAAAGEPRVGDSRVPRTRSTNFWPTWIYRLPDGTRVAQELLMRPGAPQVFLSWRLLAGARAEERPPGPAGVKLTVRPFLAGRDFHALMHENSAFSFDLVRPAGTAGPGDGGHLRYRPYAGGPTIVIASSGSYRPEPHWYRGFVYEEERRRGLDFVEDLGSPGVFAFELTDGEAAMVFGCERDGGDAEMAPAREAVGAARDAERARRAKLGGPLERAGDQYLVARAEGRSIIAGYPWFGDWGRDTFIAIRGLCLGTGRVEEAIAVLSAWAGAVSEGMLPNFFPDGQSPLQFNAVDASLWYVITIGETIRLAGAAIGSPERRRLVEAVESIVSGYAAGTRYGIHATDDGLLAAGVRGQQLTWMDARVNGREITPRVGKPVEIQALWLNALATAVRLETAAADRWAQVFAVGSASFERRFWDEAHGRLYDVVDVDHRPGEVDASFRPNQIFAVGGLPLALLTGERARRVVEAVTSALLTPVGLRSLAATDPAYHPRYDGSVEERDGAYHQGTVWPWLMGPFVEAYVRVHGGTAAVKRFAREHYLQPLLAHLGEAGLGHVSELADGDAPHRPGGCPFQAWSLAEFLRLHRVVLADDGGDG